MKCMHNKALDSLQLQGYQKHLTSDKFCCLTNGPDETACSAVPDSISDLKFRFDLSTMH